MTKHKNASVKTGIFNLFSGKIQPVRKGPAAAACAALLISAAVILVMNNRGAVSLEEFEIGKVADRDVEAEEAVSYVDEGATRRRMESQLRLVPAVFKYSIPANEGMRKNFDRMALVCRTVFLDSLSLEGFRRELNAVFPGRVGDEALAVFYNDPGRENSLEKARGMLEFFIESGIFLIPPGLENFNSDTAELLHNYGERMERERINYDRIITMNSLDSRILRYIQEEKLSAEFSAGAAAMMHFIFEENVFFSPADTELRLAEVRSQVENVYHYIERGEKIVRKGFVITEGEMEQLRAINLSMEYRDPRLVAAHLLLLLLIFLLFILHMGKRTAGRRLKESECYLLTILAASYMIGSTLVHNLVQIPEYFPVSILLPTSLVVMLPAILLGFPIALVTAMILPLGSFLAQNFDTPAYIFALCSGIAAAHVLGKAQLRMDLVKAGLIIAAVNAGAALVLLLLEQAPVAEYAPVIFWSGFNGAASGLLVVGLLPVIEHALNAVTPFRLIELSDLNSPVLKRLFSVAPGTYSHSLMVANLAETACQEIGADALLARVGAYYHDIGKMEQSEYFVENQTNYNKHKDISPRLSATVIRSHVKLGIEKARALGLPSAIIAFIAEHHGNSVITWFYNEALKREKQVNIEDFTYPGRPPRTKESAVVMLADVTEAAVRTLKKPSAARLEKYIQELFDAKVQHGQLSQSDLSFRELDTIKGAFVKVLAGYYHSRIEYPKIDESKLAGHKQAENDANETRKNGEQG
ncbi:MAG: HDIG domain-containing protein [Treponema sp.]|jgi:putative nucleotidyltransferase with HDIG domain|nr:HDIG domain-containing protein [Treponema sp.]